MKENNSQSKITSADIPYIKENMFFLKEASWEIAKQRFIMFQPEHHLLDELKQKHEKLVEEIIPLNARLESLKTDSKIKQEKQVEEFSALSNISKLKNLILFLPKKYRNDAKNFINNYILQKETTQIFPWEKDITFKQKLINCCHFKKLKKFKTEFAKLSKKFKDFSPRFDILKDRSSIEGSIKSYYKIADMLQEIKTLSSRKEEIEKQQYEIAAQTGQTRVILDGKINILKRFFDKKLFQDTAEITMEEKDEFFKQFSSYSTLWEQLLIYAKHNDIHFLETSSLAENSQLTVAFYDKDNNNIICNKNFDLGEQLFYISEILLKLSMAKAKTNYNAKAVYQHNLCANADIIAKLIILNSNFSSLYPGFEQCINKNYMEEAVNFLSGRNPEDSYSKAFVSALSSQIVLDRTKEETEKNLQEKSSDEKNNEISLGELISPYVKYGLALLNENSTMQNLLERIPASTQTYLQNIADKNNDNSLKSILPY